MTTFAVPDMSCSHCTSSIESALVRLDPQAQVMTDVDTRSLTVETTASEAVVLSVLSQIGFAANVAT